MAKVSKGKITTFLIYNGWFVIGLFLLYYLGASIILSKMNEIKRSEKFELFIAAHGIKENTYTEELETLLKEDGVKEVHILSYDMDDKAIADYYDVFGYYADALILSQRDLDQMQEGIETSFRIIDEDIKTNLGLSPKYEFYTYSTEYYGIKIYEKNNDTYNNQFTYGEWLEFKEENAFYLLLNKRCKNYGQSSDHAFKALKYLLNENLA